MQQGLIPSSADTPVVEDGWKGLDSYNSYFPNTPHTVRLRLEPPIAGTAKFLGCLA